MKDEKRTRKMNKKLHKDLKTYRRRALLALTPLLISVVLTILYGRIYEQNYIYGIGQLITAGIMVGNFVLILRFRKRFEYIDEIIKEEKKTKTKIISDKNYKLLPIGYKRKRKNIDFIDE